jgi:hypothetical protein
MLKFGLTTGTTGMSGRTGWCHPPARRGPSIDRGLPGK